MAFADPQTITVNGVAQTLNRVETSGRRSVYSTADGVWTLTISHQPAKTKGRIRTLVKLVKRAIVTNPLDSSSSDYDTLVFDRIIEHPEYGFTVAEVQQADAGLDAWTTDAVVAALYGQQS